jgi:ubiquinone/menaquinone biosynthesis C-methylase UbiE
MLIPMSLSSYERAKARYQNAAIAQSYDSWRYETPRGRRRNARDLAAIGRALDEAARRGSPVRTALDVPCGTGRLVPLLAERRIRAAGADISIEMMRVARRKFGDRLAMYQGNGEALPHADASLDCVFAIRFMFHLDADARRAVLVEMRRVTRRWLIIDFRHRHNFRYLGWRVRHRLGLLPRVQFRFSRAGLARELEGVGLALRGIYPSRRYLGWLSDKWTVLAERLPP